MKPLVPALLACLPLVAASATEDTPADPWMTDRYAVEVIVFRHLDQSRNTREQEAPGSVSGSSPLEWLAPGDLPGPGPYADPTDPLARAPQRDEPPVGFYLLELRSRFPDFAPSDERRLGNAFARLERLDAYEPIVHLAWEQGARPADAAVAYPIRARVDGAGDEFELNGTVTVFKERFVHMQVDLGFGPVVAPRSAAAEPWPTFGDVIPPSAPDPGVVATPPTWQLRESRRIRGVNAQYFDHPHFGVIALVTQIDVEDEDAAGD